MSKGVFNTLRWSDIEDAPDKKTSAKEAALEIIQTMLQYMDAENFARAQETCKDALTLAQELRRKRFKKLFAVIGRQCF